MKVRCANEQLCDGYAQKGLGSPKQTGDQIIYCKVRHRSQESPGRRLIAKDLAIDVPEIKNARDKSIDLAKSDSVSDRNCHIIL